MVDVETKFKAALDVIQSLPKSGSYKPSPVMMLQFYSYYKQATEGPCNRAKPWSFDVINKAKWDAWKKLGDMSKEEAMESYVKDLTKIIEVLPASDKAAEFIQTLGHFYEIVDPQSEEVKRMKALAVGDSGTNNGKKPLSNGNIGNGNARNHVNGHFEPEHSLGNGYHDNSHEIVKENGESINDVDSVANDNSMNDSENATHTADRVVSESDDEFCDTSADMVTVTDGLSPDKNESQASSISTSSFSESPQRTMQLAGQDTLGLPSSGVKLVTHGGQHGTHGIDEPVDPNPRSSRTHGPYNSLTNPTEPTMTRHSLLGGSGGGGEGNPPNGDRQSEVQERIAVALLQLQRDMHSVLSRLTTLETITISRQQEHCHHCCLHGDGRKFATWWPLDGLSPQSTLFILVWPFLARWLIRFWRKSRSRY